MNLRKVIQHMITLPGRILEEYKCQGIWRRMLSIFTLMLLLGGFAAFGNIFEEIRDDMKERARIEEIIESQRQYNDREYILAQQEAARLKPCAKVAESACQARNTSMLTYSTETKLIKCENQEGNLVNIPLGRCNR